ncbi:MAG: MMPL family transporter [Oscillospiraceae bacterium]|nr:MMPL family transporter [Oscillospiraceae bacterium]
MSTKKIAVTDEHLCEKEESESFMYKLATFIVDKRNLFFLLFIFALIFCFFAKNWVKVENDITTYLPEETETRQGLTLMDEEFVTYGTASVMLSNVTYGEAEKIAEEIKKIDGVSGVGFDNTEDHYKNTNAMFSVTFEGEETDEISVNAMNNIKSMLADYDLYVSSTVGNDSSAQLASEMQTVTVIAAAIILLVILFTSKAYAEIPVLILTFGAAAMLNMGTNFLLGTISFISDSVTIVLQLALAIDYAIILIHRYSEEHELLPAREACITALSKAIPEISSSSLTTVSGLIALAFMRFRIGADLAVVLIKAIFFSLLSVFTLMPGLIMLFSNLIDKTVHKNFVPKISAVGKFAFATKYIVPPIFVVLMAVGFIFSSQCPYCYGTTDLETTRKSEAKLAEEKIKDNFGSSNLMALIVPSGDYESESLLIQRLETYSQVDSITGLANIEAMDGYMLTDRLTPRQFSELVELDYEVAKILYAAYAVNDENYGEVVNGLESYGVPLIDMFMFTYDEVQKGYVTLDGELMDTLEELHTTLNDAILQLRSDNYSRILVFVNLPEEGEETFDFLQTIHMEAEKFYPENVYLVGNSTSDYDLSSSFATDNLIISILSALFVIIILIFTFKSAGLPVLLIAVIQGSIWLNFSFPYLQSESLFFLSYLIVNSIQMGANIDYAIVISSRYMELKQEMSIKDAITETLNQAFPTIITSGAILAAAGILIGLLSSDGTISSIGVCLGRGTVISIILVMGILPQILVLGDKIIERTSFTIKKTERTQLKNSTITVRGLVHGYVNGRIDGIVKGVITGDIDARIENRAAAEKSDESEAAEIETV